MFSVITKVQNSLKSVRNIVCDVMFIWRETITKMDIHEEYQKDNTFSEEERSYYILTGEGGAAMISRSHKYYVISCTLIAAYDIETALECLDDDCEISFSTPEEFANALKGRLKYIFVNRNGSYTIGYEDGYVFGGHEIDVDVDTKGMFVCAEER